MKTNFNMDILLLATLLVTLGTCTLFLRRFRQGHRRRLHRVTQKLTSSPSSTLVFGVPFIGHRHIITADPGNVQHVMKTNFTNYPKGSSFRYTLDDVFGDCIVNADGHAWRTQRAFAARQFSTSYLQFYGDDVLDSEISERLLPFLAKAAEDGRVFDFQDLLLRFAYDNICRFAFSHDPETLSPSGRLPHSEFSESFDNAVLLMSFRVKQLISPSVLRIKKALNIGAERKLKKYVSVVKRIATTIVNEKQHKLNEGKINDNDHTNEAAVDFLSRLMTPRTKTSSNRDLPIDDKFRTSMVAGVILAGRDTTSAALTWFFWLVGHHPRVEAKLLDDIKTASQGSAYEASCSRVMPYTHAALCEAMRLYPPVALVIKEVQKDDILPDGTRVGKGDKMLIAPYVMGRVERIWGADCAEFRPERWLDDRDGKFIGRDPFKFPIFNAGPRICLGKEMAFVQMKRVVAAILPRFKVVPDPLTCKAEYVFDLTAKMKGGFPVTVHHRQP